MPMLVQGNSRRDECQQALNIVAALLHANGCKDPRFPEPLAPSQIGILYPLLMRKTETPLMTQFINGLRRLASVVWLDGQDRSRVAEAGVKVQTIYGSKGLQYRAVILLWADRLPRSFPDTDPSEEPKLMYVALTRAEDYLFITHSEMSSFITLIRKSGKVVAY
jgi:superfamily I DNA/RNA helicase